MYARAVDDASARLQELRYEEWQELALAVTALGLALLATQIRPGLAMPLFLGGVVIGSRGVLALWRRWDLVDRLADQRDAYVIPEVRDYARRDAGMERRRRSAELIRTWLGEGELPRDSRIEAAAGALEALARELEDVDVVFDPACAVACRRLLTDRSVSPLFDETVPREDIHSWIVRIRDGFSPRGDAPLAP